MLPGDPDAMILPVRAMQLVQVLLHHLKDFGSGRWRQLFAGFQEVPDFAENPGVALRRAANHQAIGTGIEKYVPCFLRRFDVPVGKYGNARRVANFTDGVVFGFTLEPVRARTSMHSQRGNPGTLGNLRDFKAVSVYGTGACANFHGDGHFNGLDDRFENPLDLLWIR